MKNHLTLLQNTINVPSMHQRAKKIEASAKKHPLEDLRYTFSAVAFTHDAALAASVRDELSKLSRKYNALLEYLQSSPQIMVLGTAQPKLDIEIREQAISLLKQFRFICMCVCGYIDLKRPPFCRICGRIIEETDND